MAERRMFAKTIIDSDAFIDMPVSARLLYYDLGMRADDDGFVNSPKKIQRIIGSSDDDFKILIGKNFIIPFESGVIVIKHWKLHNYIQKDRYKETVYHEEKSMLEEKENGVYTKCIQDENKEYTQVSIGKSKDRQEKGNEIKEDKIKTFNPLDEALKNFIEMRRKLKKPMTDNAIKLLVKKLNSLADNEHERILILEQSIMNSWQGIFPLNEAKNKNQTETEEERIKKKWASAHDDFN